jgi:hypothetical protein
VEDENGFTEDLIVGYDLEDLTNLAGDVTIVDDDDGDDDDGDDDEKEEVEDNEDDVDHD